MPKKAASLNSLILSCLLFAPAAWAQTVTGSVTDEDHKVPFKGALVKIEGMTRSVATDERGRFRLTEVPAGNYTLVVSYIGTEDTKISISVPEAGLNMGDVILGASTGEEAQVEEVLIYGQAAAIAGAINQERAADNLVSALDTDAMGQFPDQNVAESLNRLPGVTVENDQGEGRYVVIRGMDPDLNSTSINGVKATTGEPRRALQLDVIPSDVLDGLEVNKTLTPDMDGDSIGGAINVKTLSAFSRNGPYLKGRVEGGYNDMRGSWNPKVAIAGSNIFELADDRRLGIAAALSYNNRKLQVDNNEVDDWEVADNGSDYNETFEPRLYLTERQRTGAVLNFDLDLSETTSLFLYSLYSNFEDTETRDSLTYGLDDIDQATATGSYTDYYAAELEHGTKDRLQTANSLNISFGSETQLENWLIESNFGYSAAEEHTPNQVSSAWVSEYESGDGPITAGSPVLSLDRSNEQIPLVVSNFMSALQDGDLFELDEIEDYEEKNKDSQSSINLDFSRQVGFGSIKFGGKARWRTKQSDENALLYSGDDVWVLSDITNPKGGDAYGMPNSIAPVPYAQDVRDILASGVGIELEELDSLVDSNIADFKYDENIFAAYAMAKWEGDMWLLTGGVRVEQTDTTNRGNIVEIFEEGQIVNGIELEDDTAVITPISKKTSYTDWLPSANFKFEFSETLTGRASVYKSVVRPRVEEVAYRVAIEDREAELGNPDLDPFRAWSYDMSIAYYPTELSVMSAGVFYKSISDFVFVQEVEDYVFEGRQLDEALIALNGKTATVAGLELNYQQHFGFLGEPWDAFLVALNYTYVDSEANTGERKIALPKQSQHIGSFMIGYDKHGLDLRLALKYRSAYIDELVEPGYDRYTDDHLQLDATAKYRFNDNWQVYAEFSNLGDRPEYYYAGQRSRAYQYDEYGQSMAFGVQYNFQ